VNPKTGVDIFYMPAPGQAGSGSPVKFVGADISEGQAQFSPDGSWVAFATSTNEKREVYVRRFPSGDGQWKVSTNGKEESSDSHLRSSTAVTGYHVEAKDGEIGHVHGFVIDDKYWNIRYIEIATRNWLPGKKVLVSPEWIERVSWPESKIYAGLFRQTIQDAPEYLVSRPLTREYESRLYFHYGRPPYWEQDADVLLAGV
jgi:hypothetical protein